MTRSEMALVDACFIGPLMLFLNQYFNSLIPEYFLLSVVCVSIMILFSPADYFSKLTFS